MTIANPAERPPTADRLEPVAAVIGDPQTFLAEHWDRYPLHHRDGDFSGCFSFAAMWDVIGQGSLATTAVNIFHAGQTLQSPEYANPSGPRGAVTDYIPRAVSPRRVRELFDDGATVSLNGTSHYWPPMRELCEPLSAFLGRYVSANVYALPADAEGVEPHHDTHDVILAQIEGRKHWRLWKPNISRPLPQEFGFAGYRDEDVIMDVSLEAGETLYIPRGFPHASHTTDVASLHVTLGIEPLAWIDLVRALVDEAAADERLREALPLGAADGDPASAAGRLRELADAVGERIAGADYATAVELVRDGRPG